MDKLRGRIILGLAWMLEHLGFGLILHRGIVISRSDTSQYPTLIPGPMRFRVKRLAK